METDANADRKKCGDILINIRTIKNKAKMFTFHCALCSVDCDQLKKFSKHLEKHLYYFDDVEKSYDQNKATSPLFEPEEVKADQKFADELIDVNGSTAGTERITSEVNEDPLETAKSQKELNFVDGAYIKTEMEENVHRMESCENESIKSIFDRTINIKQPKNSIKDISWDELSEYSNDADFDIKQEMESTENVKSFKDIITKGQPVNSKRKKTAKEMNKNLNEAPNKPKKRRRVIIDTILPFLIKQYKMYKILWQVDEIAFGIKNKKYEIYGKIAEALKLEAKRNISLEDINHHINYINELYSKDKEEELKCKMENKDFLPQYEYYTEMSFLRDSQGPFLCEICNEILPKYDPYCQHMAQHNETQPFKCPSCDMMFSSYHKYLIHKKRHLGILDFHCSICGKGYLFKNDLEWHVTSHTGDKPHLCQICGAGFRARHGYDNHIRRHEERFRHECHICKKGFNQLYVLNIHIKSHLNIRDVICEICGKGFVHTKYLRRHELIHGTEKRYKCNECGKAFFQACGLRAHRKNHHF